MHDTMYFLFLALRDCKSRMVCGVLTAFGWGCGHFITADQIHMHTYFELIRIGVSIEIVSHRMRFPVTV